MAVNISNANLKQNYKNKMKKKKKQKKKVQWNIEWNDNNTTITNTMLGYGGGFMGGCQVGICPWNSNFGLPNLEIPKSSMKLLQIAKVSEHSWPPSLRLRGKRETGSLETPSPPSFSSYSVRMYGTGTYLSTEFTDQQFQNIHKLVEFSALISTKKKKKHTADGIFIRIKLNSFWIIEKIRIFLFVFVRSSRTN